MRVLVTDAEFKLTLGAIRSLGQRGVEVVAGSATRRAQGFASRFCAERVVYSDPGDAVHFVRSLAAIVADRAIDVVLPIGYDATRACARHRSEIAAAIPVADAAAVEVAASKRLTLELAERIGVPVPRTYARAEDVSAFPIVAKPERGSGDLRYVNSAAELDAVPADWLLQEYVRGEGRGLFAVFDKGVERAVFMHRRVREFPVTGGASTAAEPVDDPQLRELGLVLLRALRWHGVAMVEFKLDERDGTYKLMEVNPKFWGSLDLAIAAGVDFPWLAVQLALGKLPSVPPVARSGFRFQWVFPDLLHAVARPADAGAVIRDLLNGQVEKDVCLRDLKPSIVEAVYSAVALWRRATSGTLRSPHGTPAGGDEREYARDLDGP